MKKAMRMPKIELDGFWRTLKVLAGLIGTRYEIFTCPFKHLGKTKPWNDICRYVDRSDILISGPSRVWEWESVEREWGVLWEPVSWRNHQ
jgi:hypothetical protein